MTTLVTCDSCPNEVDESKIAKSTSNGRLLKLCPTCYIKELSIVRKPEPKIITIPCPACKKDVDSNKTKDLAGLRLCLDCHERESILINHVDKSEPVTSKNTMVDPVTEVVLSQSELFKQAIADEQLKIDSLDLNTPEGQQKLFNRIAQIESIAFEAKARATILHKNKRELEAKSGKTRWDKERGKENASNNSDPKTNKFMKTAVEKHKQELSKVEKAVKGFLDIGDDDMTAEELDKYIIDMLTTGGKFKGIEVREAIEKMRKV